MAKFDWGNPSAGAKTKLVDVLNRLFRVERGEWSRLLQFGLFGFLLQAGLGVGFSAGDAAFLSHVGADRLPLVFIATPVVMIIYTAFFSYFLVRTSIDRMVDITLGILIAGGLGFWFLIGAGVPNAWQAPLYFALKLYLVMWYIALYSLFWNYTDAYFDIQDAKRLFPLFAAFCSLGTATGASVVGLFAEALSAQDFFLLWAALAALALPLARTLRRRWPQIAESDNDDGTDAGSAVDQLAGVVRAFGKSRYAMALTATLFVTLLMTNLAEYQYSVVLQEGRSEAELAALFGALYAGSNLFNLAACLFLFNRLVARFGVRNVAFVQPLTYFAVFGWFFLKGGTGAALAAFFAYHGVLTSIEYNNQNLLFNAVPSRVKRPLRTMIEGMAEPLASLIAGAFLIYAASRLDMRELSGIGLIVGAALVAMIILLRQLYPAAMTANMRQGWMNFGTREAGGPRLDADARWFLEEVAGTGGVRAELALRLLRADTRARTAAPAVEAADGLAAVSCVASLLRRLPDMDAAGRAATLERISRTCNSEGVGDMLFATAALDPRDRRTMASIIAGIGESAIPSLIAGMGDRSLSYRSRIVAAYALAELSYAQFASHLDRLVRDELQEMADLQDGAVLLKARADEHRALALLARAQGERVGAALDFVLEMLAVGGRLPDFDLLIVSLHSANAKVRGNAIEAIESGLDAALFRWIGPLLRQERRTRTPEGNGDIAAILDAALGSGQAIEATLAADAIHARFDMAGFVRKVQVAIHPGMPPLLRDHLLRLTGLSDRTGVGAIDRLAALAGHPEVGGSTLESLLILAEKARQERPADAALDAKAGAEFLWISRHDLHAVAGRFPDLALVLFKTRDSRHYAA